MIAHDKNDFNDPSPNPTDEQLISKQIQDQANKYQYVATKVDNLWEERNMLKKSAFFHLQGHHFVPHEELDEISDSGADVINNRDDLDSH